MQSRFILIVLIATGAASGQTKISGSTQIKDVDYSNAKLTKPFRSGSALPATCSPGEAFNLSTAVPGTSLYLCAPANQWTQVAGTSVPPAAGQAGAVLTSDGTNASWAPLTGDVAGSPGALAVQKLRGIPLAAGSPINGQSLVFNGVRNQWEPGSGSNVRDWPVTRTSDSVLTIGGGPGVRFGGTYCTVPASTASVTVGSGTGTLFFFIRPTCELVAASNLSVSSCSGCTATQGDGFEANSFPLAQWPVAGGVLDAQGVYAVTPYGVQPLLAGQNIQLTYSGGETQINAPNLPVSHPTRMIGYTFDIGGGPLIPSATKYLTVPFACTLSAWNIIADQGTATIKTLRTATGTAIPQSANSISLHGVSLAAGTAIHSADLSDFTSTAIAANDILGFNLAAVTGATYVNFILECVQ